MKSERYNIEGYMTEEGLIQETFCVDPWQMLIACIMLNKTSYIQVRSVIKEFFRRWPDAHSAAEADDAEMSTLIKPLGLYNRRTSIIKKFSKAYTKGFDDVKELPGIGQYASDSYDIFIKKNLDVKPSYKELIKYLERIKNS